MSHDDHDHKHGDCCDHDQESGHEHPHKEEHEGGHDHDHGACGCEHEHSTSATASLAASGVLIGSGLLLRWLHVVPDVVATGIFVTAIVAGGWMLLPSAWASLRRLRPDINLLMAIAVLGASVIGEWAEAASVVFLFGVAEWLEGWADRRAHRATEAMLALTPETARVRQSDGNFVERPVGEVPINATIAVQSGQRIPLDGKVTSGQSAVNQAPITGESMPVGKKPGDDVFAGTINGEGSLELSVTKAAANTVLARIVQLVEEAQAAKAPTQRYVDVFARYYTPTVTVLALLVFLTPPLFFGGAWMVWLYRACVLLIIACPCALVISTPVSIVAGLTALTRRGVLVKGGAHLEALARLKALAMDKTGTITEGKPRVLGVTPWGNTSVNEVVRIAAAIEDHSPHPLARSVVMYAREQHVTFTRAESYQTRSGRGAEGVVDGHPYFVGNHRFTHELGVCSPELEARLGEIEGRGESVVVVGHRPHDGCAGGVLGVLADGDTVRPNAASAIAAIRAAGVKWIVMLSGDNQRTVDSIARQAGVDEARGDLLPADKVAAVQKLRDAYGTVGMVGDGVNDAPAMATANLGIAMGVVGTDAAIETADIALMEDDLSKISLAVRMGRRTLGIIRFNIAFALGLKAVFLTLAVTGHTSLWLAIMADTGATLLVVANALRLLRIRPSASVSQA